MDSEEIFDLPFGTSTMRVEEVRMPGQTFFRISFSNQIPPLTVLRATNANGNKFWTSVPEGRQELAEQVGAVIEDHYRSKVK